MSRHYRLDSNHCGLALKNTTETDTPNNRSETHKEKTEMDTMTFDEIMDLLRQPPNMERTLLYIEKRRCWAYLPLSGRAIDYLPKHVKQHQRACFNCRQKQPEYAGLCWGNMSCEIWVCQDCVPTIQKASEEAKLQPAKP